MVPFAAPLTGDNSQITLYVVICIVAVVAMAGLITASVISRKKKGKEEDTEEKIKE